ncbi:MAG: hypothetical protein RL538_895 [Candidatus Parcubacteria bacterium]|jgi:hypothetical protein
MEDKTLGSFLTEENPFLTATLNCHLATEVLLDKMLSKWVKDTPAKTLLPKYYKPKLDLLLIIGILKPEVYKNMMSVNKLRTKFAHEIDYKVTRDDILLLGYGYNETESLYLNLTIALASSLGYLVSNAQLFMEQPFSTLLMTRIGLFKTDPSFSQLSKKEIVKLYQHSVDTLLERSSKRSNADVFYMSDILNI